MFKSSLFCCLSLLAFTIPFQVKAELLCPPPPTATTLITINAASTPVTQTACVVYYEVSVPANLNKFLIFEVRFKNMPNDPMYIPYLVADKDKAQLTVNIDSARLKPNAGWSDSNGLINRKNYHHITFSLKELNSGSPVPLYFAIYKAYVDSAHPYTGNFEYDVQVITSVDYICPQSCVSPSHGTCDTNAKRCNCQKGFFDEDCSVAANEAALNVAAQKTVGPNSWGYFFFNIGDFSSDLKISLQKNLAVVDFSFLINEKDDYTLPNAAMSTGKYELTAQQSQGYLLVQEDNITPRKNDVLLIGVYNNEDTASVTTQVLLEVYDDSSVLRTVSIYLMIGISLVFLLIWLGLSAFQYKKHTQMESLIRVYQVEREEEKTLTKKDINKYFPKEKFKDLKTSFCQTMCSVCLEDFEPETNCRQLYCEHIFHGNCIEAWLNQHYNCPNCKKDITKVAIEEHLKEKANKEEKMILVQENAEGRRGAHGHTHTHSHASAHPHSSEGGPNAINAQRVHVQKQHPEESKDDHGINLENPDHHAHRRRDLPASHLESGAHETNLQVAVTHEEMKSRHLVRGGQSANQSHVQEPSSRSEINSRAQNLRKANRRAQGTVVPANPETEVNAFRLDL